MRIFLSLQPIKFSNIYHPKFIYISIYPPSFDTWIGYDFLSHLKGYEFNPENIGVVYEMLICNNGPIHVSTPASYDHHGLCTVGIYMVLSYHIATLNGPNNVYEMWKLFPNKQKFWTSNRIFNLVSKIVISFRTKKINICYWVTK